MGGWRKHFESMRAKRPGPADKHFVTQKEEEKLVGCPSPAADASPHAQADTSPSWCGKWQHCQGRWCPSAVSQRDGSVTVTVAVGELTQV